MDDKEKQNHSYLGDSVYAEYDVKGITLRTGDHRDDHCDTRIYIEGETWLALTRFVASI